MAAEESKDRNDMRFAQNINIYLVKYIQYEYN